MYTEIKNVLTGILTTAIVTWLLYKYNVIMSFSQYLGISLMGLIINLYFVDSQIIKEVIAILRNKDPHN